MADPWASVGDVAEIAGVTVQTADVAKAQAVIETLVGRTAEATVRAVDLTWLRRAVAYQTAWMMEQADLFTRTEVQSASQDGASATYRPDSHILAPLARRALKRLSWRGNLSTVTTRRDFRERSIDPGAHWIAGVFDEGHERWVREEL